MDERPFEANHIGQETLRETVFARHLERFLATLLRQGELTVSFHDQQTIAFHARHCLRNSGSGVAQTFRDPRSIGRNSLFLQIDDGAQIHLRRIDEICHQDTLHTY